MKLLTKQLKTFNSIAGAMPQNKVLPILSYLKFDNGYITKNNLESFVTMEADFKGSCLIDEKILMSFVNSTNTVEIDVKVEDKTVVISHGKEKMVSPTDDIVNFPKNEMPDTKEIEISQSVINAIKIASNFTLERDNMPYTQCVFLGNGMIAATTGYIAYVDKTEEKLPEIIIEKDAAAVIKNFDSISFSENGSYQYYTNNIFKFGFIKKDTKYINMKPFAVIPDEEKVEINKSEIIKFCDTCVNSSPSKVLMANIKRDKLIMVDADYGINYEKPISVILKDFCFNPALMGKMLKSLPDEKVYFVRSDNKYYVTGDSGFISLIMEMQQSN